MREKSGDKFHNHKTLPVCVDSIRLSIALRYFDVPISQWIVQQLLLTLSSGTLLVSYIVL